MAVSTQKNQAQNLPPNIQADIPDEIERLRELEKTAPPITTNPERMGGTPVIGIERLPVEYLIGYLMNGGTVNEFVDEFGADREKVLAALQLIREALAEGLLAERVDY
ncbi:MAG: DUF433 domain-containing protein [Blastocatellia bacterium]